MKNQAARESECLFHYTDSSALLNIVRHCEVWATQLGQMNDSSEGKYVSGIAAKAIKAKAVVAESVQVANALRKIEELVELRPFAQRLFVFSLSEKADSLSQWRAYTPGGGFSLGINKERLTTHCDNNGWELKKCVYCEKTQKIEIEQRIQTILNARGSILGTEPEIIAGEINEKLSDLSAFYKHPSFQEEDEWRIIIKPNKTDDPHSGEWRPRGAAIVEYRKIDLTGSLKMEQLRAVS